jgi:hypothetical protein
MKKVILTILLLSTFGCATIFHNGPITEYQRTKPLTGEAPRKIKVLPLVADVILFWPATIVDFASGAIYLPKEK